MGSPPHWEVTFEQNPNAGSDLMETQKTGLWNSHQGKDKQEIKLKMEMCLVCFLDSKEARAPAAQGARQRVEGLEVGGRILQGLGELGKDFGFYSSCYGAPMG